MSNNDSKQFTIEITPPPPPGLDIRYRPSLDTVHEWTGSSNSYRPNPVAIGNDWLMEDIAHYAAVWGASKMLDECRHWISREVDPSVGEEMWQDLRIKFTI